MIGFILPLDLDTNTVARELRKKPIHVYPTAITRLHEETSTENMTGLDLYSFSKNLGTYTQLDSIDSIYIDNGTTWEDTFDDDYDVVSKLDLTEGIKMKVKIKSVTKFVPKIELD